METQDLSTELNNKKNTNIIVIASTIVGVLVVAGAIYYWQKNKAAKPVVCAEDTKVCLDGTVISRTGPSCEFADCPKILSKLEEALKKIGVNVGNLKQESKVRLPKVFTGDQWSLRESNCRKGGYDIKPYAGEEVVIKLFETGESYKGKPLDLWVMVKDDKILCAYEVATDSNTVAPGVFPITSK